MSQNMSIVREGFRGASEGWGKGVFNNVKRLHLKVCVRDAMASARNERGMGLWEIASDESKSLSTVASHLDRVHRLRQQAREYDEILAEEQTRCLRMADDNIKAITKFCDACSIDISDRVHKMMETRPRSASIEETSVGSDGLLCTERLSVQTGVDTIHPNLNDIRSYFDDSLARFLCRFFDGKDAAAKYVEELIIISMYTGPVTKNETKNKEWAFHVKGRAVQNVHDWFGIDEIANDDRYIVYGASS